MKNILIPTDFSENAWNATRYAIELFKSEACNFHLLNTYTPAIASSRFMATSVEGGMLENGAQLYSERGLRNVVDRISKVFDNPKHNFITSSSFSFLVDQIKETVEEKNIDLVVTGTKGASGLEEVFMGSNTVRIIKSIKNCPVLAVPQYSQFVPPNEIAFATDFNRFYTKSELQPLQDLARIFRTTIHIVHIRNESDTLTEHQQFNLSMLHKYLKDVEHYVHTVSELNSISKTLEVFTEELEIHLLAMLNYQHSFLEKISREPVIKRIAFHTQMPLLVIPELGMQVGSKNKNGKLEAISN